jgi:hypothetical protein
MILMLRFVAVLVVGVLEVGVGVGARMPFRVAFDRLLRLRMPNLP